MLRKDCFRLISRSFKRFLSLFFIVTIGVAMMVGLLSTVPIMRHSVAEDYRHYHVSDIEIFSTLGFDENDIREIEKRMVDGEVMTSRFVDVYGNRQSVEYVIRVEEAQRNMNEFELLEGRLPITENEAVIMPIVTAEDFKPGEILSLYLKDDDLGESLKHQDYEIVGVVRAPQYMTHLKETSTLDNQKLNTVVFVPNTNFKAEIVKRVSLRYGFSDRLDSYSEAYEQAVETEKETWEEFGSLRSVLRRETVVEEANGKIADAKKELAKKVAEADAEIATNEQKLREAKADLDDATAEIDEGVLQLAKAKEELESAENLLNENETKLKNAIAEVEKTSGMSLADTVRSMEAAVKGQQEAAEGLAQVNDALTQSASLQSQKDALENGIAQLTGSLANMDAQIHSLEADLQSVLAAIAGESDPAALAALQIRKEQLEQQIGVLETQKVSLQTQKNALENQLMQVNAALSMFDIPALQAKKAECEAALAQLNAVVTPSFLGRLASLQELSTAVDRLAAANESLRIGKETYTKEKQKLDEGIAALQQAYQEYDDGIRKIAEAKQDLAVEVFKAEKEIREAENEVSQIQEATWIVLGPQENYHRVFYQNTMNQMNSIALTIPILFFLVAALVCLTTMTRLLEEERSQIGLYSALGFSKIYISMKYIMYALLASVGGSILGATLGILLLPGIIYHEWNLMYSMPLIRMIITPEVLLLGISCFALLMGSVSAFVAFKSLKESPSQLMRPKAPKKAKKTVIERIPPIWNRLGFISRITVRNILRYKARFFMTVIGVAGCTALLILGFGIKDSIRGVINIQYGEIFLYRQQIHLKEGFAAETVISQYSLKGAPFLEYTAKVLIGNREDTLSVEVYKQEQIHQAVNIRDSATGVPLSLGEGVVISEKFAINHNLHPGSLIRLESEEGKVVEVKVDAVTEMYFQHYAFLSAETYEKIFAEKAEFNSIALPEKAVGIDEAKAVDSLTDFAPLIANFQNMIKALDIIIMVIVLAAGSLAFVVLNNLTQVNIAERTREIATLKVLGFTEREVQQYIYKEIAVLSLIGAVCGLPLGKIEHAFVMNVINMEQIMYGMKLSFFSYAVSFAMTILFTLIVLFMTRKTLRKLEMIESLKSVE